ncbi:MAG: hypothetical protein CME59_15775 [Halioglobus sp.]|nr:hypothetical protein [Halioglobus sp.]|tara:strand:+ start:1185 stop:1454 length:270 start_codon:yes stop_codon:yes gene_type:complete
MKILLRAASASALLAASAGALAAKPTSIVFNANGEASDGTPYSTYTVKCSNGQKAELTAWDNRRKWCVGGADSEACEKKQIKAAKAACK